MRSKDRKAKEGGGQVPPLLPILEQQVDQLRAVEGLDDLVSELSRVSEDVRQLIDDIATKTATRMSARAWPRLARVRSEALPQLTPVMKVLLLTWSLHVQHKNE